MRYPLARALAAAGLDGDDVAARLGVDPKTVQRWFAGRVPYPRHRAALATLTGWAVRDLWPSTVRAPDPATASGEIRVAYSHRSAVPLDTWHRLFADAQREIGVLAYSALFLAEDAAISRILRDKARAGVRVRIALGDLDGKQVARRSADEGISGIMPVRIRNALHLYQPLTAEPRIELRLHDTVLYNSIYRADDDLLVNVHLYGCPAAHAPVLHLHHSRADGMAATYVDSFERVWTGARHFA